MDAFEFYASQLEWPASESLILDSSVLDSSVLDSPALDSPVPGSMTAGTPVIIQYFDQDLIGDTGTMLKGFYESGQLWALLIGLVLGYMLKSFTSYG